MSILLDGKEIEEVIATWAKAHRDGVIDTCYKQAIVKATGKKIALKLQAIYNLPDGGAFSKRMGEFIEELMGEVGKTKQGGRDGGER